MSLWCLELFYTERTHLRQLKVIERFFRRPLREENYNTASIFQNLDEVIEMHGQWISHLA